MLRGLIVWLSGLRRGRAAMDFWRQARGRGRGRIAFHTCLAFFAAVPSVTITQTAPDGTIADVTGKNPTIVVGQRVNLTAAISGNIPVATHSWDVPGSPVSDYQISPTIGKVD